MEGAEAASNTNGWQIVSVKKIWDQGKHNAFTDLIRYSDRWFCTFREGDAHVGGDGRIRVLTSSDGEHWTSAAALSETGIDLRDPKFSITPDNRLMLVMGGSVYEGKTLKGRQPRVSFSSDGRTWTTPKRVLTEGEWLWRVTWDEGKAYGISYSSGNGGEWITKLVQGPDGVNFSVVTNFVIHGRPNEGTLRFFDNNECVALVRREAADKQAWIGSSRPPYTDWAWQPAGLFIGGPNFIILPGGQMVASGREMQPSPAGPKTFVGPMTRQAVKPAVILPSGGDTSYAGMVWQDDLLWVSYYSSHEGKSAIYVAQVKIPQR